MFPKSYAATRRWACGVFALGLIPCCLAQPAAAEDTGRKLPDQKIERIRIGDAANQVDELRYGGVTRQITVQPRHRGAAYDIVPGDASRAPGGSVDQAGGSAGHRVWNLFNF